MRKFAWLSFIDGLLKIPLAITALVIGMLSNTKPELEIIGDGIAVVTLMFLCGLHCC